MDRCEMCFTRKGRWYVVDDNAEVTLCAPCVKDLRAHGEKVEPIR